MLRITLCILAMVPMIYNVAWSQDGLMKQAQAIFKPVPNVAPVIKGNPSNPGKISLGRMLGVHLTPEEIDKTVVFLETLTGKQPKLEYPVLPPSTDVTPQPILK